MALYGIALLPLAEKAKAHADEATTPWFADDSAGIGHVEDCAAFLEYLTKDGPIYGYYPEPEKSYFVCKLEDEPAARTSFHHRGLKVNFCRGRRYIGGLIGSDEEKTEYVKKKIGVWADGVKILSSIARRFPQTAYAGLTISLQADSRPRRLGVLCRRGTPLRSSECMKWYRRGPDRLISAGGDI
eukprot:scaffold45380_cov85-Cyclotella_meneghiniana.AAC.2